MTTTTQPKAAPLPRSQLALARRIVAAMVESALVPLSSSLTKSEQHSGKVAAGLVRLLHNQFRRGFTGHPGYVERHSVVFAEVVVALHTEMALVERKPSRIRRPIDGSLRTTRSCAYRHNHLPST